jgi:hypothetical protein
MHDRRSVMSLFVAAVMLSACGGGGDGGSEAATVPTPTTTSVPAPFACPVTRAEVETAYPRIDFLDSTSSADRCTFTRFDESGAVEVSLEGGGASFYASSVAELKDTAAESIAGVGDEAVYSESTTTLVARSGDDVLTLRNKSISGFVGEADQSRARHDATIALAKAAFASR